jgi:hypothetical protein
MGTGPATFITKSAQSFVRRAKGWTNYLIQQTVSQQPASGSGKHTVFSRQPTERNGGLGNDTNSASDLPDAARVLGKTYRIQHKPYRIQQTSLPGAACKSPGKGEKATSEAASFLDSSALLLNLVGMGVRWPCLMLNSVG